MKINNTLKAITLLIMLGSVSLAHAEAEYGVYWMDNASAPKLAFTLNRAGDKSGMGADTWSASGTYQGWKGNSLNFYGPMYIALINPQGTASMVFHGAMEDRSGQSFRGEIMIFDHSGKVITHDAVIK